MTTPAELAETILSATFRTRASLRAEGMTGRGLTLAVAAGTLLRLRNGRYVPADLDERLVAAGRLGGRLDCVSLLHALGVFVRTKPGLHLQLEPGTTRLPSRPKKTVPHWRRTARGRDSLAADIVGALAQACRCQGVRDAVATLDSAWHHGLVDEDGIADVFALLPRRYQVLRGLLDRRSESGCETLMRLLLRGLGGEVQIQVRIAGVGRVDMVVDGWLIVECDSKAHHEGWDAQKKDRRRDLRAAALGYTTVRPLAEDILFRRDELVARMRGVLAHGPVAARVQNSTRSSGRSRRRAAAAA